MFETLNNKIETSVLREVLIYRVSETSKTVR